MVSHRIKSISKPVIQPIARPVIAPIGAHLRRVASLDQVKSYVEDAIEKYERYRRNPLNWGGPTFPNYDVWLAGYKSNSYQNSLLALLFQATSIANIATTTGLTALYVSLHTADPGAGGGQNNNETGYTNYTRTAVNRAAGNGSNGFTISGSSPTQVVNNASVAFPACGATGQTVTNASVGANASGTNGVIYYSGPLTSNLAVSNGITPSFAASALVITED
jgi:hypothetical protein